MLDTIFMIFGIIFVGLIILVLVLMALGIIQFGVVAVEPDEHSDVGGSHGQ